MRTRLLDATVDCLVSYGYAGTTTPRSAWFVRKIGAGLPFRYACHP